MNQKEWDTDWWLLFWYVMILCALLFAKSMSLESQIRDLQRRVGQIESERR